MKSFKSVDELISCVGQDVSQSDWITIEQDGAEKPACIAESVIRRYH